MSESIKKMLLSGNEAVALAAHDAGVNLGCGYPGTPSSEILDEFNRLGGRAEWAPNEKCALEVAIGVALANGRALVTMKHVGLNVALMPALVEATFTDEQTSSVLASASGMDSMSTRLPSDAPFCTSAL